MSFIFHTSLMQKCNSEYCKTSKDPGTLQPLGVGLTSASILIRLCNKFCETTNEHVDVSTVAPRDGGRTQNILQNKSRRDDEADEY